LQFMQGKYAIRNVLWLVMIFSQNSRTFCPPFGLPYIYFDSADCIVCNVSCVNNNDFHLIFGNFRWQAKLDLFLERSFYFPHNAIRKIKPVSDYMWA
jgi:hypothetical protein